MSDIDMLGMASEADVVPAIVVGAVSRVPSVKVRTSTVSIGIDIVLNPPPTLQFRLSA